MAEGRLRGLDRGERAALVLNELQVSTTDVTTSRLPELAAQVDARRVVERALVLADACRRAGVPVVHCTIGHPPGYAGIPRNCKLLAFSARREVVIDGTPAAAIAPALGPAPGDHVAHRHRGLTPWYGDALSSRLEPLGVETLILAGVSTNLALPGIAIEAVDRGYTVVVPEDATAGTDEVTHRAMVATMLDLLTTVTDVDTVVAHLAAIRG